MTSRWKLFLLQVYNYQLCRPMDGDVASPLPSTGKGRWQTASFLRFALDFYAKKEVPAFFKRAKRFTTSAFGRAFENSPRKKELSRIDGGNWYSPVEADFLLDAKSVNSFNPVSGS